MRAGVASLLIGRFSEKIQVKFQSVTRRKSFHFQFASTLKLEYKDIKSMHELRAAIKKKHAFFGIWHADVRILAG